MINIMFIAIFIMFPILIIYFYNKYIMSILQITIPNFLFISMFAFSYIGIFPLYFYMDDYYYIYENIQDREIIFYIFLSSLWSIITITLGFWYAKYVLMLGKISSNYYQSRALSSNEKFFTILIFIISLIVFIIYLSKINDIALFTALSGEGSTKARSLMGNGFSGNYKWYKLFMRDIMGVTAYIFYASWLIDKKKSSFFFFLFSFLGIAFSTLMNAEKSPFAWTLIGIGVTYILIKQKGSIQVKTIIKMTILIIPLLIITFLLFSGFQSIEDAFKAIFSRAFAGSIAPAYNYFIYFPLHHDFLCGQSFPNPGSIFPFIPFSLTIEIQNFIHPNLITRGVVGSAPTVFWAEMYANFNIYGIILSPFIVGVTIYVIAILLDATENTPIKIALVTYSILHFSHLAVTGVSSYVVDIFFFGVWSIFLIAILLSNNLKIKLKKN